MSLHSVVIAACILFTVTLRLCVTVIFCSCRCVAALRGWGGGTSSLPFDRPKKQPERDFMALNRSAVSAGLVTSKENFDYRATHDIRRRPSEDSKSRTRRLPASMVFGLPTRWGDKRLQSFSFLLLWLFPWLLLLSLLCLVVIVSAASVVVVVDDDDGGGGAVCVVVPSSR